MSLGAYLIASYLIAYSAVLLLEGNFFSAIGGGLALWLVPALLAAAAYWKGGKQPSYFKLAWIALGILILVLAYPALRG